MTEDKLNITIRIAGQNPVALKINRADEERVPVSYTHLTLPTNREV